MARFSTAVRVAHLARFVGAVALVAACNNDLLLHPSAGDHIAAGTWGGDNAAAIVSDSGTHVHIGCTLGDVTGRVPLDSSGRFTVSGSYQLHAYPVELGPTMPAQFVGQVSGGTLVFTVTVTDTVAHSTTVLGPATVVFGRTPSMGVCPVCRTPSDRMARRRPPARKG